jgi:hypothetical protein
MADMNAAIDFAVQELMDQKGGAVCNVCEATFATCVAAIQHFDETGHMWTIGARAPKSDPY